MRKLFASANRLSHPSDELLAPFARWLALEDLPQPERKTPRPFYRRAWCPRLTLWYLIGQRLSPHHPLAAVVADARRGGADALSRAKRPLSRCLRSSATTAFARARRRLPLAWVMTRFERLARALVEEPAASSATGLPVRLRDGSTLRLRPHGDIPRHFPPHRTARRQRDYWCVGRTVVAFGAERAGVLAARLGSLSCGEQPLAVRLILPAGARAWYVGDRNFGVWRVVRATAQAGGQVWVRLTGVRAGRRAEGRPLRVGEERPVSWRPSRHDQGDRDLRRAAVTGRLVAVRVQRRGWRSEVLYRFTTLTDTAAYPPAWLAQQYGRRWRVEGDWRWVKSTLGLNPLEVKSADLARQEFYAGLMAYNLVRGLMRVAARAPGVVGERLSFTTARVVLWGALGVLWLNGVSARRRGAELRRICEEIGRARQPRRRKPRPSEPQAQYHVPNAFPALCGTRAQARRKLRQLTAKS